MLARFLKSWLPVLFWMAVIFLASTDAGSAGHTSSYIETFLRWLMPHLSPGAIDRAHLLVRKAAHVGEYAVLGALALRAFSPRDSPPPEEDERVHRWKMAALALAVVALYAASDEFHQSFVPSRGASAEDVLIDTCGAFIGIAVLLAWRKHHPSVTGNPESGRLFH